MATSPLESSSESAKHCRMQQLQRKCMCYARGRLHELQKICPEITESLIAQHGLHKITWSLRRAGKQSRQSCLPRSASAETDEHLEKQCTVQHGDP
eukprot:8666706-Karenia_brevis.AAC.1